MRARASDSARCHAPVYRADHPRHGSRAGARLVHQPLRHQLPLARPTKAVTAPPTTLLTVAAAWSPALRGDLLGSADRVFGGGRPLLLLVTDLHPAGLSDGLAPRLQQGGLGEAVEFAEHLLLDRQVLRHRFDHQPRRGHRRLQRLEELYVPTEPAASPSRSRTPGTCFPTKRLAASRVPVERENNCTRLPPAANITAIRRPSVPPPITATSRSSTSLEG
jgi:hypothetical protein